MTQEEEKLEIGKIEGLNVQTGLERVSGLWDVYKKSLKLSINEIQKCDVNLNKFLAANEMRNFTVEAHSMKGLLANIGALELSALALELEDASDRKDAAFCAAALPPFLKALCAFGRELQEIFAKETPNGKPIELPSELSLVFDKLKIAFYEADFFVIDEEMENLDALDLDSALKDEIDKIKDAVMMMDYNGALEVMSKLLKQ